MDRGPFTDTLNEEIIESSDGNTGLHSVYEIGVANWMEKELSELMMSEEDVTNLILDLPTLPSKHL